jgi:hypothetical protein
MEISGVDRFGSLIVGYKASLVSKVKTWGRRWKCGYNVVKILLRHYLVSLLWQVKNKQILFDRFRFREI